jgi:hypothetical protein
MCKHDQDETFGECPYTETELRAEAGLGPIKCSICESIEPEEEDGWFYFYGESHDDWACSKACSDKQLEKIENG